MKKTTKVVVLASVLALGLVACTSSTTSETMVEETSVVETETTVAESIAETTMASESITVKIGVVGENNEQWDPVIEAMAKENVTIELVKFADYSLPNRALHDGEIELNAFQHKAYLANDIANNGYDIVAIGDTVIAPLGVYSKKIEDLSALVDGDTIAIPNDATNGGRALKVLESAGVITVDPEAGYTPVLSDIIENPKNIQFYEVEAANTASLLDDVSAAVINGGHAVDNGLNPVNDSIFLEAVSGEAENPYVNVIVARTEDANNEIYQKIVDAYRSDDVAAVIQEVYKGAYIPTWE